MIEEKALRVPFWMIGFAAVGVAIAFYDSYAIYNNLQLWCPPPIDGCNTVAYSPYAKIFNMPLGYLGLVFYVSMVATAALLAYDPRSRGLNLGALGLSVLGVTLSVCFMVIQFTFIQAFCIYCLISFILTLILLGHALAHYRSTRQPVLQASSDFA